MTTSVLSQSIQIGTLVELNALRDNGQLVVGRVYQTTGDADRRWFLAQRVNKYQEIKGYTDLVQSVDATGGVALAVDSNGKLSASLSLSADAGNAATLDASGKLFIATPPAAYVSDKADTNSVALDVTAGVIKADVKVSANAGNAIAINADGIYAQEVTIHPDSVGILSKDASGQIKMEQVRFTDIHDATSLNDLAAFVAAFNSGSWTAASGKQLGTADVVLLDNAKNNYMFKGAENPTTVSTTDFVEIEGLDLTDAQVRALISGTGSIVYNSTTGVISFSVSTKAGNDLVLSSTDGKAYVSVKDTVVPTIDATGALQLYSVQDTFNNIYQSIGNGVTNGANGVTKNATDIELGGVLNRATEIDQAGNEMKFKGGEVKMESAFFLSAYETDAVGAPSTAVGTRHVFIDVTNNMLAYLP